MAGPQAHVWLCLPSHRLITSRLQQAWLELGQHHVRVSLLWATGAVDVPDLTFYLHLLSSDSGDIVAQQSELPRDVRGRTVRTSLWRRGTVHVTLGQLPVPASLTPGTYRIVCGLYDESPARPHLAPFPCVDSSEPPRCQRTPWTPEHIRVHLALVDTAAGSFALGAL